MIILSLVFLPLNMLTSIASGMEGLDHWLVPQLSSSQA
jgi:hypothetical protein